MGIISHCCLDEEQQLSVVFRHQQAAAVQLD